MEDSLSLDNILGVEEIDNLFIEDGTPQESSDTDEENNKEDKNKETTEVVDVDELFTEEPESVGSGNKDENKKEKEDTNSKDFGTSPNNFFSSIAKALKDEGIFPDLEDDTLSNIKEPEDFRNLIEQQIKEGLNERQKRIDEALNVGIEPTEIKKYENVISYLDSLDDNAISNEEENGEKLRKNLIYQDFVNRGYSVERANREVEKSFNGGTDIEDAKEALKSNKEYFKEKYDELISNAKSEAEKEEKERRQQAESLKNSLLNDKDVFGDLTIDKSTRQKVFDNLAKPIYKDPETGNLYTALQKYEMDNRTDFLKNVGLLFTLTDGFKNLDKLVNGKVKKEVKKGLRQLEATLNNTSRTPDGNLKYISGVNDDTESFIEKGWKLDV